MTLADNHEQVQDQIQPEFVENEERFRRSAPLGRDHEIALIISRILHPISLSILTILLVGWNAYKDNPLVGLRWASIFLLVQIVPPTIFFLVRLKQGVYTDEDVSNRHQRNELYLIGFALLIANMIILKIFDAPPLFTTMLLGVLLLTSLCWLINLVWKISIHAATMGASATVATFYAPPVGVVLWICALLLAWARVRTRNHTPLQVAAGLTLAALCVTLVFRWLS